MDSSDDILSEFLIDCHENLEQLDEDLIALETRPEDNGLITSVFRIVHTIKGNSGFMALPQLEKLTHAGEHLLVPLREGVRDLDEKTLTVLLEMVDAIRRILSQIEADGTEGPGCEAFVLKLESLAANCDQSSTETADSPDSSIVGSTEEVAMDVVSVESTAESNPAVTPELEPAIVESAILESTVRLDVSLLEKLMNQVGELVIARNQILEYSQHVTDPSMLAACQSLSQITRELQEGILKTRMRPVGNIWTKFPRQIRELCQTLGKNVQLRTEGAGTEIDKTVLEAIRSPLTHIVRNAIDHGIESSVERQAVGKTPDGNLVLRAFHEGGFVVIEVTDDGRGLDLDRIREKAVGNGLVTAERSESLSVRELHQLVLLPGFSTADSVTNVSGRGVGMDVVKTSVEAIGGSVDIQSELGIGTTLRIRIPLTLAIIPALIVGSVGEKYAIPQITLVELLRLNQSDLEYTHDAPVFRRRGRLLPLLDLHEVLTKSGVLSIKSETVNVAVLQSDDRWFGLAVDEICDAQEVVVKPLSPHFQSLPFYAGATILGDGRVSLILDVNGIANECIGKSEVIDGRAELSADPAAGREKQQAALIVDDFFQCRFAFSLSSVSRLEEFDVGSIEISGEHAVVQYRDAITPLIHIDGRAVARTDFTATVVPAVICRHAGVDVGIIVHDIVDVIDDCLPDESVGYFGQQIIVGRTTTLTSLASVIENVLPGLSARPMLSNLSDPSALPAESMGSCS